MTISGYLTRLQKENGHGHMCGMNMDHASGQLEIQSQRSRVLQSILGRVSGDLGVATPSSQCVLGCTYSEPLSPLLSYVWRAQHEINGPQTGLQGTHGFHKEVLGVPAAGDLELAGLHAPIILPYVNQGSFHFYLLHILNYK